MVRAAAGLAIVPGASSPWRSDAAPVPRSGVARFAVLPGAAGPACYLPIIAILRTSVPSAARRRTKYMPAPSGRPLPSRPSQLTV
jgi:hypothetical protein